MNFVSYRQLADHTLELVPFCVKEQVSAIYGVPRSGMLPATILANALQLPLGIPGQAAQLGRRVRARISR